MFKKKWPNYNKLVELISNRFGNEYKILTAPGHSEINDAKDINALVHLCSKLNIPENILSSAIDINFRVRPEEDWKELKGRAVVNENNS